MNLARSLRTARAEAGDRVAVMGLFHLAWQLFDDRWLNIPVRRLSAAPECAAGHSWENEESGIAAITRSLETLQVAGIGDQVLAYLQAGFDGSRLLNELGRLILWNDTGRSCCPLCAPSRRSGKRPAPGILRPGRGIPPAANSGRPRPLRHRHPHQRGKRIRNDHGDAFRRGPNTVDVFDLKERAWPLTTS